MPIERSLKPRPANFAKRLECAQQAAAFGRCSALESGSLLRALQTLRDAQCSWMNSSHVETCHLWTNIFSLVQIVREKRFSFRVLA